MGPSRSCWNGTTSALQPEKITSLIIYIRNFLFKEFLIQGIFPFTLGNKTNSSRAIMSIDRLSFQVYSPREKELSRYETIIKRSSFSSTD